MITTRVCHLVVVVFFFVIIVIVIIFSCHIDHRYTHIYQYLRVHKDYFASVSVYNINWVKLVDRIVNNVMALYNCVV